MAEREGFEPRYVGLHERTIASSIKISQKPLALLGDWSVTVGALSALFDHLMACPAGVLP